MAHAIRVHAAISRYARASMQHLVIGVALFLIASGAPVADANAQSKNNKPAGVKSDVRAGVPGDDIFGFTSPTDVGDKGDLGFANELSGFQGKRDGSFLWLSNKLELGYTFADNWWVAGSVLVGNYRIHNVAQLADRDATTIDAAGFEIKHRIIGRSHSNPFAVTLGLESYRTFTDIAGETGRRADGYIAVVKIYTDAVIIADKVFWAANALWLPARQQSPDDRSVWLKGSGSSLSSALTFQPASNVYVGAEIRHLGSFNGMFVSKRGGYAYYLGPTLLWKIADNVALNATWQPQIAGRSIDHPALRYDLDHFERTQFRFKLAVGLN